MKHSADFARSQALDILERLSPYVARAEIAGSLRRGEELVKDIEIVALPNKIADGLWGVERPATQEIQELAPTLGQVRKMGDRFIQLDPGEGRPTLDLFLVTPPAEWGTILAIRTGPADFSRRAVTRIKHRGWTVTNGQVLQENGEPYPTPKESDFFRAAQMDHLPPSERV